MTKLRNVHPGEALVEEFLSPLGISQNRLAREIGVPPRRISEIVHGTRAVTADTAHSSRKSPNRRSTLPLCSRLTLMPSRAAAHVP